MLIPDNIVVEIKPDYLGIALIGLTVLLLMIIKAKLLS